MTAFTAPARQALAGVSLIEDVRAAALAAFHRFARELDEPRLDAAILRLIFNVGASRVTRDELAEVAGFIDDADPLIERALNSGWIEPGMDRLALSPRSKHVVARLTVISQRNNQSWREQITQSSRTTSLDEALATLRGPTVSDQG